MFFFLLLRLKLCIFVQILQFNHTERINALKEQIVCLEKQVAANQEEAEEVPVLKNKLDVVKQSLAHLNKSLEASEKSLSCANEIKADLEVTLSEKVKLITALEDQINNLTEKLRKESESHSSEVGDFVNKERSLKEQLEATRKSVAAAKEESSSRREDIREMKTTLSAASRGLEERDNTIKSLKEKLNKAEAEQVKASELLKEKTVAMSKIKVSYEGLQIQNGVKNQALVLYVYFLK